jgi:FdhD protein
MYQKVPCIRGDGDAFTSSIHEVVEELPVALFINGRHAMTAMMTPVRLEDFVTGYLFTEQIIKSVDEIESVKVEKNRISVLTKNVFKSFGPKRTILSGCGGSTSYIDIEKLPRVQSGQVISPQTITNAVKTALDSEVHRITGGIHLVGLFNAEGVVTISEDIGRHNALDRVIGYGLSHKVDFSRTYIVSSGRISSEMVRKCLMAQVPVIISRGATTTLAISIAEKSGLTLIGFTRGGKMNIYTHAQRVEGAGTIDKIPS